jgi:hypothetical protein
LEYVARLGGGGGETNNAYEIYPQRRKERDNLEDIDAVERIPKNSVEFEVFTAVTMKNAIF